MIDIYVMYAWLDIWISTVIIYSRSKPAPAFHIPNLSKLCMLHACMSSMLTCSENQIFLFTSVVNVCICMLLWDIVGCTCSECAHTLLQQKLLNYPSFVNACVACTLLQTYADLSEKISHLTCFIGLILDNVGCTSALSAPASP
jgi:hypothetical protein